MLKNFWNGIKSMFGGEGAEDHEMGATLVEYILLVVGIALVVAVAVKTLGGKILSNFNKTSKCIDPKTTSC